MNNMIKTCESCHELFPKPTNCSKRSWKKVRFCSRRCRGTWMKKAFSGRNNPNWKGGSVTKGGYRLIFFEGKRMYEHRHVMEQHIKRKLLRSEVVHHIDGNKLNNSIENLQLFVSVSAHNKSHYPKGSRFGKNVR